ncbi:hypothetical protein [Vibrio sp. LaRot3]|uniref:hypothetical protein n=1 Tax=Vibrio sp. LaRot3 TaxID=2998829 RepID=UPI0022CDBD89|nr:hypothetical protein [Vibrio sp. LaRot3]MDA0149891.1 hypothetical protein [Vibrio sp. LaRot3]
MFKKIILSLILLSSTIWVVYINYEPPVSGFVKQIEKGVLNLKHTVKIVDEADTKHSSPYFYSTYSPEDELYEPVLAIQQERAYDAVDKLEELAAQDNADALYWLAIITYKSSAFSEQTGAELFERSAKLGNPYAALMLDENNYECKTSMPSHCDKKWGVLAKELLIEREKNGDLEALYSLIPKQLDKASKQDHEKLDKLAYEGFNQGYLLPLYTLVFIYQTFDSDSDPDSVYSLTEEERAILNQLVLIMANRHHLASVYNVINNENNTYSEQDIQNVVNSNLHTMGNSYPSVLYYLMDKTDSSREDQLQLASFAQVADTYQNSMRKRFFRNYAYSINEDFDEFSEKELGKIEQLTIENLSKSTPNIYITMGCPRTFGSCLYVDE